MTRSLERRMTTGEVEVRSEGSRTIITGHAAVFDRLSDDLGGFVERVRPTAFTKTIQESDVRALYNHDENMVLGRSRSGTLRLSVDDSGLYYEIDPPNTSYANDLRAVMERGDVNQSSFAFFKIQDDWSLTERNYPLRDLIEVGLVDVSPVTYPAYPDADSGVSGRAALQYIAKRSNVTVADLEADPELLARIIRGEEAPVQQTEEPGETHSEANRWARRAQFMRDLEDRIRSSR